MADRKLTVIPGEGAAPLVVRERFRLGANLRVPHPVFDFVTTGTPYYLRLRLLPGGQPSPASVEQAAPPPETAATAAGNLRGARTFPVGKRDLQILKIGRRKRRLYRVTEDDLARGDCWLSAAGWYVDTLRPPANWISNDPFGPYQTAGAAEADAELAYRDEEA